MNVTLERLRRERGAKQYDVDTIVQKVDREKRDLTPAESATFAATVDQIRGLDVRIAELADVEQQAGPAVANLLGGTRGRLTVSEPDMYAPGSGNSYFADRFRAATQPGSPAAIAANERIARVQQHEARTSSRATRVSAGGREMRFDLTTVAGAGGEFAPPLWAVDKFIAFARPGRATADACEHQPVPPGVSSVNIPKIASGTSTAAQVTQNTAVSDTAATTGSVAAPLITIAGMQTISQQDIDQGPANMDQIILSDLAADYAQRLDVEVLNGTGAGHITGLMNTASINAVTYTDAAPTVVGVGKGYNSTIKALQLINSNRFAPATALVMTPARWAWFMAAVDTQNRPLVVPNADNVVNGYGSGSLAVAQGPAGHLGGVPVYLDANIPTNLGAGTNQDVIIGLRGPDVWLYESELHLDVLTQTYGSTLTVLVRAYAYAAIAVRYPKALATVGGTGLVTPVY